MVSSLKNKVYITLICVVLLSSGFVLQSSLVSHKKYFIEHSFTLYQAVADNLSIDLLDPVSESSIFDATTRLLTLDHYEYVQYATVLSNDHEPFSFYIAPHYYDQNNLPFMADLKKLSLSNSRVLNDGQRLIIIRPIGEPSYPVGKLLVSIDLATPLQRSTASMLVNTLTVVVAFVLFILVLLYWMNRTFFKPLHQLAEFSNSITSTDSFNQRAKLSGDIEVRELGEAINTMMDRVEQELLDRKARFRLLEEQKEMLRNLVNYDTLTKLPNRKFFMDSLNSEIARAKRNNANCILLFLDIDNFKDVNDSIGHKAGDTFLIKVTEAIQPQLRDGDILGRIGGDEFLVLITDVDEQAVDVAISVSERILNAVRQPIKILDWEFNISVSIGIAAATDSNFNAETMIKNADIAMYKAKHNGKNNYEIFKSQLHKDSLRKIKIANAIVRALDSDEFSIHYQAKIDAKETIQGFEALIRWETKHDEVISPGDFIPIAENSGKIKDITRWVINQTFSDLHKIIKQCGDHTVISINLSVHDIKDISLIGFISERIAHHKVDAKNIEFEVTESAYLDNFEKAKTFFDGLRNLGFKLALDDFGTGYSSMSYLTKIHVDTLKIDREFIMNLEQSEKDKVIVEAILNLSERLKLQTCAEGVETEEQKDLLFELGCHTIQGFYYSKPLPLNELKPVYKQYSAINT